MLGLLHEQPLWGKTPSVRNQHPPRAKQPVTIDLTALVATHSSAGRYRSSVPEALLSPLAWQRSHLLAHWLPVWHQQQPFSLSQPYNVPSAAWALNASQQQHSPNPPTDPQRQHSVWPSSVPPEPDVSDIDVEDNRTAVLPPNPKDRVGAKHIIARPIKHGRRLRMKRALHRVAEQRAPW